MANQERTTGQTRDTGFEIGVRRTLPIAREAAWRLLTSRVGVQIWLGEIDRELLKGVSYCLADGTVGEVTVFSVTSHLRMTWQPSTWDRASIIQIRVLPSDDRTTIAFHQEWLPGPQEREERRAFFVAALGKLQESSEFKLPDHFEL